VNPVWPLIWSVFWSSIGAIGVEDVPNPRTQNRWVSDTADLLAPEDEARLDELLARINHETQAEVALVTVHEVSGTPKQFATALFNHWGVGSAARNDGVLFLMVMDERRLEVEVGYGLEATLPDGWLGTMQANSMVPRFKQGDFGGGLEVGIIEVGRRLGASSLPDPGSIPARASSYAGTPGGTPERELEWPFYALFGVGGLGLFGGLVRGGRVVHHKRCRQCKRWRRLLCEVEDDAHLEPGQVREEEIGSVDYDVYVCCQCSSVSIMRKRAWFSGYSRCGSCRYRTLNVTTETITAATTYSDGQARVTEDCQHCNHHSVRYRRIPRIEESSSDSSYGGGGGGGGSSFGGGSSGGGGAGSSW
jgi:uncharacterized protein